MESHARTLLEELTTFYLKHGFGDVVGSRPKTVPVYTGCMLVPLPNIETRRKFLKYHDLHHLVTGYGVGRIGEGEVSSWELGTGSMFVSPLLGVMNLIALSTGLFLEPKRMWRAFRRGCHGRNLYGEDVREGIETGRWPDLPALRHHALDAGSKGLPLPARAVEFAAYAGVAMLIHAFIAIPAVIARFVTDTMLGHNVFRAARPVKRSDLY